ncbi:hypothetical protein, partial [Luteitalea sp.]
MDQICALDQVRQLGRLALGPDAGGKGHGAVDLSGRHQCDQGAVLQEAVVGIMGHRLHEKAGSGLEVVFHRRHARGQERSGKAEGQRRRVGGLGLGRGGRGVPLGARLGPVLGL